ncbi:MAG: hypothetical protein PHE25_05400 [Candidatus Gracilibacteria bacterium]|nr:hypothetical protein [Candidatus Gracilibacteria bacterium]
MKLIHKTQMPLDQGYYRTTSPIYKKYLENCGLKIHHLPNNKFGWIKSILGLFQIAKFERVDEEPNIERLKKDGFKRGFVIRVPYSDINIPKGWRKLRLNSHFTTSGYTDLENEYYKKWKERSKRSRKKFLENPDMSIKLVDTETFQKHYKEAKTSQPYKSSFMKYHKTISLFDDNGSIKNILCYHKDKVVAGLAVINYNGNSSAHLVAFLTNEGKTLQAGTGVMDYWFKMSLENGIKYINFDHLRDKHMGADQQGYTDFKENFMDYKVLFEEAYFKWI